MSRWMSVIVALAVVCGVPSYVVAQTGMNEVARSVRTLDKNFDAADKNRDGKLTREEAQAGPVSFIAHNFDAIDTNHHGYVTKSDVHAYIVKMLTRSQASPAGSATTSN